MTVQELSDLFDLMSNAFQRQSGFGSTDYLSFNEYEKSVYLTMAQQMFVISCYNGKNQSGYQFEITEEDRRTLDSLVCTAHPTEAQVSDNDHIVSGSKFYKLPMNTMFITYEQVVFDDADKCIDGKTAVVMPVTQDEFWKTYNNPFRSSNKKRVLRLDAKDNVVELVSKYTIDDYQIRYLKKPSPIILVDMPDGVDLTLFDGNTTEHGCDLDSTVHEKIVELAVNMALQRKSIGNTTNN